MDCSNFKNFVAERERMCRSLTNRSGKCNHKCPLFKIANNRYCMNRCFENPTKAIEIVQKWSDENAVMTRKKKFLEMFPTASCDFYGLPTVCAGGVFGFECKDNTQCKICWNTAIEQ